MTDEIRKLMSGDTVATLRELLALAESGKVHIDKSQVSCLPGGLDVSFTFQYFVPQLITPSPMLRTADPALSAASWNKREPSYEWRSMDRDAPDWGDSGDVELKDKDGTTVHGEMDVNSYFDGESSHPVHEVTLTDGRKVSPYGFVEWRYVPPKEPAVR